MYKSRDRHRFAASRKALKSSQNGEVIVDNNRSLTPGAIAVNPPANDSRGSYSDEESHQHEDDEGNEIEDEMARLRLEN